MKDNYEYLQKNHWIFLICLIIILTSFNFTIQLSIAQDSENIECSDCHPRVMERHQFPTYPCTSCHSQDMSTITLRNGKIIPLEESTSLCAQCHNTIHDAWMEGKHGRTEFKCIECHDPHFEIKKSATSTLKAASFSPFLQMITAIGGIIGMFLAVLATTKVKK